jgi:hypothetical protein
VQRLWGKRVLDMCEQYQECQSSGEKLAEIGDEVRVMGGP